MLSTPFFLGKHIDREEAEYVKVKAFRLDPRAAVGDSWRTSDIGVDGERLSSQPIDVRVYRGVMNALCL